MLGAWVESKPASLFFHKLPNKRAIYLQKTQRWRLFFNREQGQAGGILRRGGNSPAAVTSVSANTRTCYGFDDPGMRQKRQKKKQDSDYSRVGKTSSY